MITFDLRLGLRREKDVEICKAVGDASLTLYVNAVCSCRDGGLSSPSTGTLLHVLEAVR